jgi:uncharacterized glyoxalase superfamily protein PhnB
MVAEHVVLAGIHQQSPPGQFIKSITTGYDGAIVGWKQTTYDQALFKISQAFRDKCRDNPLTPPVIIMDGNLDSNMENKTAVETTSKDNMIMNMNMNNSKQVMEHFTRLKEAGTQLSMELEHQQQQPHHGVVSMGAAQVEQQQQHEYYNYGYVVLLHS